MVQFQISTNTAFNLISIMFQVLLEVPQKLHFLSSLGNSGSQIFRQLLMEHSFIKPSFAFGCLLAKLLGLHLYSIICVFLLSLLTLNKHVQMVCSTCLLYVLRQLKIISFTNSDPSVPSDSLFFVPFRLLLRTTPLSLAYLLYMVC